MKKSNTDPKWFTLFWRNSHLLGYYYRAWWPRWSTTCFLIWVRTHFIGPLQWCWYSIRVQKRICQLWIDILSSFRRLPFNWHTKFGYLLAMIIFAEVTFYILYCGVVGVCLLLGSCWLIQTIVQDVAHDVDALNVPKRKWNQNRMEMKTTFNNFINVFSSAKQLSIARSLTFVFECSKNV